MYGFTLAISCCVKTSNIPSKFVKYIDVPLFKAVTSRLLECIISEFINGNKNEKLHFCFNFWKKKQRKHCPFFKNKKL